MSTKQLYLFSQLPLYSKFRFETADHGKVFVKTSETHAFHDKHGDGTTVYHADNYQPVSPNVLVFPVFGANDLPVSDDIQWEEVIEPEQGADRDCGCIADDIWCEEVE